MKTHYDVLQIQQTACVEVITAAYRALSKKYHPDICTLSNALELMQELNTAKDTLTDATQRARYDLALKTNNKPQPKTYYQNSNEFNPNTTGDIKYYDRIISGKDVRFKLCVHGDYIYINFYTEDNIVFAYLKDMVKNMALGKWNPDTKFWKCHESNTSELFIRFGLW